jgi:inosose dehydratase
MAEIKWGYAINQWRPMRTEQRLRAFKAVSACGFEGIELESGSGRGAPIGNPEQIQLNFGSVRHFFGVLNSCGVKQVVSFFYNPESSSTEASHTGKSPVNPQDHEAIVEAARPFAQFLRDVQGSCFVVKAMPSYPRVAPVTEQKIKTAAECWTKVGKMTREYGIQTAMHIDCISAIHSMEDIDKILQFTDPVYVGLVIDTAELTIAGNNPIQVYEKYYNRVKLFHFKDTHDVDSLGEYKESYANSLLSAGGKREIGRWFWEMGSPGGLVDFPGLLKSIKGHNYDGWIIVESDQSPNPCESAMLNNWYVRNVLSKI